jgi:hypothetical protein
MQRLNHIIKKSLDPNKVMALESLNIAWDSREERWQFMYGLASGYFKTHGHLRIPKDYVDPGGENLGAWISLQRNKFKKEKNYSEKEKQQKALLDYIGMVWQTKTDRPKVSTVEGGYSHVVMV